MKFSLQHFGLRPTEELDRSIEREISGLRERLKIDEAIVRLACHYQESPPYKVQVHIVTPGPDVFASGSDHTLRAAVDKALSDLQTRVAERGRKIAYRQKSNLGIPVPLLRGVPSSPLND